VLDASTSRPPSLTLTDAVGLMPMPVTTTSPLRERVAASAGSLPTTLLAIARRSASVTFLPRSPRRFTSATIWRS